MLHLLSCCNASTLTKGNIWGLYEHGVCFDANGDSALLPTGIQTAEMYLAPADESVCLFIVYSNIKNKQRGEQGD